MNFDLAPALTDEEKPRVVRGKRVALGILFLSSFVFGILDPMWSDVEGWEVGSLVIDSVVSTLAILAWMFYDARLREYPLGLGLRILTFLIVPVGLAVFLVKSRGWGAAAKAGFGLWILGASMAIYLAVCTVVEWLGFGADGW